MKIFVTATLLSLAGLSSIASADTYNFSFDEEANTKKTETAVVQPAPTSIAKSEVAPTTDIQKPNHFRASSAAFFGGRSAELGSAGGITAGLNYLLSDRIHLNAIMGLELARTTNGVSKSRVFGALEGEYVLLRRLSEKALEAGVLAGLNTFHTVDGNPMSAHIGGKLNYRLSHSLELMGALRANLGFAMAETGVAFRI